MPLQNKGGDLLRNARGAGYFSAPRATIGRVRVKNNCSERRRDEGEPPLTTPRWRWGGGREGGDERWWILSQSLCSFLKLHAIEKGRLRRPLLVRLMERIISSRIIPYLLPSDYHTLHTKRFHSPSLACAFPPSLPPSPLPLYTCSVPSSPPSPSCCSAVGTCWLLLTVVAFLMAWLSVSSEAWRVTSSVAPTVSPRFAASCDSRVDRGAS